MLGNVLNKYNRWYEAIIANARCQERCKVNDDTYYESHHILPVSLGGDNMPENLVLLTAREHYIAHLLLVHMTEGLAKEKMARASLMMVAKKKEKRYTSRSWAVHREFLSKCLSENHRNNRGVTVAGVTYHSIKAAGEALNMSRYKLIKAGLVEGTLKKKYPKPQTKGHLNLGSYEVTYVPPKNKQNIKPLLVINSVEYASKNAAAVALGTTLTVINQLIAGTYVPKDPVIIGGVTYKSISHASKVLRKAPHTIKKMLADPNFKPAEYRVRTFTAGWSAGRKENLKKQN